MRRNLALVALLLLAAGGVVWVTLGTDLLGARGGVDRDAAEGAPEPARTIARDEGAGTGASEKGPSAGGASPVLFGRPREAQVGVGSLSGRVLDFRSGKPVAGAVALLAGTGNGGESVSLRAASAPDGTIRMDPVAAGEGYTLRVEGEGLPSRTLPNVDVAVARTTDVGTIWLGQSGVLEGIVVDPAGHPVAGAVAAVHLSHGSMLEMVSDMMDRITRLDEEEEPLAKTETARDGKFRIEGLSPGPFALLVRADGYAVRAEKGVMTAEGAAGGPLRVVLASGQGIAGRVVTEAGEGIGGARIAFVREQDPESFFYGRVFARTAADGTFRVDGLSGGGAFMAIVAAPGYPTTFGRAQAGQTDARFVLKPAVPLTVRVLMSGSDAPVVGAQVSIAVGDATSPEPESLVSGTTDDRGGVLLQARAGKIQMAFITHPEHPFGMWMSMAGARMGLVEGPEDATVPPEGREVTFRLPPAVRIVGRLTGPQGEPLVGARVQMMGFGGSSQSVLADADGRYSMVGATTNEGMGIAILRVKAPGYVQKDSDLTVSGKPDERGEIVHDMELLRAGVVTGRVTDAQGKPLGGATVTIRGSQGEMMAMFGMAGGEQTVSLSDGSFVFDGAAPGDGSRLSASLAGWVTGTSEPFEVKAGETVRAPVLVLDRGATLLVRVLTAEGGFAAGARVQAEVAPEGETPTFDLASLMQTDFDLKADDAGIVRLEHLAKGSVTVTASAKGYAAARAVVRVSGAAGSESTTEVRLRRARAVTGTVVDGEGKPVAQARVEVSSPPSTPADGAAPVWSAPLSARTAADGTFRVEGVPEEGALSLSARAKGFVRQVVALGPQREGLRISLVREDPDRAKRRQALSQELSTLVQQFMQVKDDSERQALTERMQELQLELAELGGAEGLTVPGASVVEIVEDEEPAPPSPAPDGR